MDAGNFEGLFYNKQKMGKEKTLNRETMLEYDDDDNDDSDNSEEEKMKVSTFSSAAGKKGSNGGGGSGIRCCQAEKCAANLTDAKPYYRRHKVCQLHAKSQVVLVAGICKRFCQQCSRFHELAEFDDTKRSCRRRLAGHNERRRKGPGEPNAADGSNRKASTHLKGTSFRKIDDGARIQIPQQENASQSFSSQIRSDSPS